MCWLLELNTTHSLSKVLYPGYMTNSGFVQGNGNAGDPNADFGGNNPGGRITLMTFSMFDCPIRDPIPFSRQWHLFDVHGPSVKYGVCLDLKGNFAWLGKMYKGGVSDPLIFREQFAEQIPNGFVVLSVHPDFPPHEKIVTARPADDNFEVVQYKEEAIARHKAAMTRVKEFAALTTKFRHSLSIHSICFESAVVLSQCNIENGETLFET